MAAARYADKEEFFFFHVIHYHSTTGPSYTQQRKQETRKAGQLY